MYVVEAPRIRVQHMQVNSHTSFGCIWFTPYMYIILPTDIV